ncbi:MAG: Rossmann-like domain-containing protein [Promethearchaeota archaeon]
MILEKTIELIKRIYKIHKIPFPRVNNIVVGVKYTGVEIATFTQGKILGLCYTLPDFICKKRTKEINKYAGDLTDIPLLELLNWTNNSLSLKKIIGIATLNALSQHILSIMNPYEKLERALLDYLEISENSKIIFIGFIKPLADQMAKITNNIVIIDDSKLNISYRDKKIKNQYTELTENEMTADVLICTGTALINNTMEDILKFFRNKVRKICILGPTASMVPDILFDYGADLVGGIKIKDSKKVLKIIQEGGGTKKFKNYGKKYNLIKNIKNKEDLLY